MPSVGDLQVVESYWALLEAITVGHLVALIVKDAGDVPRIPLVLVASVPSSHRLVIVES